MKKYGLLGVLCIDRVNGDEGVIGGEAGVGNEMKVNVRLDSRPWRLGKSPSWLLEGKHPQKLNTSKIGCEKVSVI